MGGMLNIANISKQYGNTAVLNNIDFKVEKASIIGLAGPSGSGKSTLLRCIQKLEKVDKGSIEYSGISSFMFQDFQLFPHMTVLENLVYAPKTVFKNHHAEKDAMILLEKLGMQHKANDYPGKLSGGQKQRVALARCLMMKPDILLCDEPTSGLDVATIQEVTELLNTVHEMGVTMIIASHDVDFLTHIASRIVVLKNGFKTADMEISELSSPSCTLKLLYQEEIA